jgi:macrodomain Ter protein organizer (MatP/YcbG family)
MKRKQSRHDWLKKDSDLREWIAKTLFTDFTGVIEEYAILTLLNQMSEKEFNKIKQRWNSHSHRAKRKSISCDITPASHLKLKALQGKKSLTETLEEIIKINYDANKLYRNIFEERLSEIKTKRDLGMSRELNKFGKTLEAKACHQLEIRKLNQTIEEQEGQIEILRSIASIIADELTSKGHSLDRGTLELIKKNLNTLIENNKDN